MGPSQSIRAVAHLRSWPLLVRTAAFAFVIALPGPTPHPSSPIQDPATATAPTRLTVQALGDSITVGRFASSYSNSWFPQLQSRLTANLVGWTLTFESTATSGWKLNDVTNAAPLWQAEAIPDVVIIQIGENDEFDARYRSRYDILLDRVRDFAPNAELLCVGPWMSDTSDPESVATQQSCQEHRGTWVDISRFATDTGPAGVDMSWLNMMPSEPRWQTADTYHPNDAGHSAIADAIWQTMKPRLPQPGLNGTVPSADPGLAYHGT